MDTFDARAATTRSVPGAAAVPTIRWGGPRQAADLQEAFGAAIVDDAGLDDALRRLVTLAANAIDGAASCGVTVAVADRTFTAVHSDARTLIVDAEQYEAGDGPCLHAARTGEIVRVDAISAETRWPQFVRSARQENVRSFLAAPLTSSRGRFGSLNLYGETESAFTASDVETATSLTGALAGALGGYDRFDRLRRENSDLRFALEHRAPIEQAKGILIAQHRIDADAAFDMLVVISQRRNRKVRDIAVEMVADNSAPIP